MAAPTQLLDLLAEAQRIGLIGPGPLAAAVAHAGQFVRAIPGDARTVVDLGSGGGLPGLVIACERADLRVVLVDRRERSTDFLSRATRALDLQARTEVVLRDAVDLAHDAAWRGQTDVVTARGLAPPARLCELALALLVPGGRLVVSAADDAAAWPDVLPESLGASAVTRHDGLVTVNLIGEVATEYPRRRAEPPVF